jgi:hypothetical protein
MYQNHEPLWQAPMAGFCAGLLLYLWFRWQSRA